MTKDQFDTIIDLIKAEQSRLDYDRTCIGNPLTHRRYFGIRDQLDSLISACYEDITVSS